MTKIMLRRLKIKNVGMVADETVELNKALILFYGEIRNGKTTILNSVKWALGAPFPSDIIRHGEKEASATLEFDGGSVGRSWYRDKEGETTARPVTFIREGKPVQRPMDEIRRFMNPFLLDQDHLRNMTETERKGYFTELFALDTTEIDKEATAAEQKARTLRITIKAAGDIDAAPVERIDVSAVRVEMGAIQTDHAAKVREWESEIAKIDTDHKTELNRVTVDNRKVIEHNAGVKSEVQKLGQLTDKIAHLKEALAKFELEHATTAKWLIEHQPKPESNLPIAPDVSELRAKIAATPDTSALQAKLNEAAAVEVRYEQYQSNLVKLRAKQAEEKELSELEKKQRDLKTKKIAKLKTVSESSGIKGLEFDETGNFVYDGTSAGMLSTSQLMKLSSDLSALYPAGFGIELLDRGESLGKSIFQFIERAKREEKTILASIVGEKPAVVPDDIGVWVVEGGRIKP